MARRPTCKVKGCRRAVRKYVGGRPPTTCEEHDPKKKRTERRKAKDAKKPNPSPPPEPDAFPEGETEEELERAAGREVFRREGSAAALAALKAYRPQFLAVHLRDGVSPETAAALAGVTYEDEDELAQLVEDAAAFGIYAENNPQARAAVLADAFMKGALRLAAGMHTMPVAQLPNALHRMAETIERIAGKSSQVFTHLGLVIEPYGAEDGERWDPRELLPEELRGMSPLLSSTTESPTRPSGAGTTRRATASSEPNDVH